MSSITLNWFSGREVSYLELGWQLATSRDPISTPTSTRDLCTCATFYTCAGDLNSGPQACTTSALPTESRVTGSQPSCPPACHLHDVDFEL